MPATKDPRKLALRASSTSQSEATTDRRVLRAYAEAERGENGRLGTENGVWIPRKYRGHGRQAWRVRPFLGWQITAEGRPLLDNNGRRVAIQETFYGRTPDECLDQADVWVAQIRDEKKAHGSVRDKRATVEERWNERIARRRTRGAHATSTSNTDEWAAGKFLPLLGRKPFPTVTPRDLRGLFDSLEDEGLAAGSRQRVWATLAPFVREASIEMRFPDPTDEALLYISFAGAATKETVTLQVEDAVRLLDQLSEIHDGSKWFWSIFAGFRQGERLGATWDEVDFREQHFFLRHQLQSVSWRHGCAPDGSDGTQADGVHFCGRRSSQSCPNRQPKLTIERKKESRHLVDSFWLVPLKGRARRDFPIPDDMWKVLLAWRDQSAELHNPHGLIWPRFNDGRPWGKNQDERLWHELLAKVGLVTPQQLLPPSERPAGTAEMIGTHSLRGTAASLMLASNVPPVVVMQLLGHKDIETTLRHYARAQVTLMREHLNRTVDLLASGRS